MKICLTFGGIVLYIMSAKVLKIDDEFSSFLLSDIENPDITVSVSWNWEKAKHPFSAPAGSDLIQTYYRENGLHFCEIDDIAGTVSSVCYPPDFSRCDCTINGGVFPDVQNTLGNVLRMLPMRAIFLHFHTLFLHAAQISMGGTGILFAAPSGTGKTTQAKLWQEYRGAEIICSDRTLTRKTNGEWKTYGYPLDGSEPVRSGAVNRLGCIVLLRQDPICRIERLRPAKAIGLLMRQAVMDCWDGDAKSQVMELFLQLLADVPVYLLSATPDEDAVFTLEKQLIKDGVIPFGSDSGSALGKGRKA